MIYEILEAKNIDINRIELIGIASPGIVSKNSIIKATNLSLYDFNICEILEEKLKVKVKIRNDAKCSALAEKEYGVLKNIKMQFIFALEQE